MKTLTAMIIVGSRAAIVLVGLLASASWTMACVLDEILEVRDDQEKSRDISRHPKETLLFFDVRPGMTVVETLPGQGWYSKILVPYIGPKGHFIAANYPLELFAKVFGARWGSMRQQFEDWPETFPMRARTFAVDAPKISTYSITAAPHDLSGSVDRILFIRSLHHLNRFDGRMLESSARESFRLLKVGGIAGVVQHRAPASSSEIWADGSNGYLHVSRVVSVFEDAGFTLVAKSELNANPKDRPNEKEKVWRLPPALRVDSEARRKHSLSIGESDRMTLKFIKMAD